ncbi:hypothetical protein DZC72_05060 [Maribacter algicola]|uniref:STAS/SEC14 domain-containing protein n=1 Tax=Maribacter algicola TaxID=2498892 RepID=A0A426RLS9_9FLAO|nr:hypothetical protein [Maribacter algicola]RRQ49955.1 hypothetical protein DZC72_05060 [Maribacter algicola]
MKRVKDIPYFKNIREVREFEFGVFYYFDGLVISEINEGVVFDWNMAKRAVAAAKEIFGEEKPIAYISNRINSYTVVPTEWLKFYKNRHQLSYYSVVGSTQGSFASIVLEKMFFKESLRQFNDLEAAVAWSLDRIKEKKETLS